MALSDLTQTAVLRAIEEFDRLGRARFLQKYEFGKSRGYVLEHEGRSYDSKAIAGAAHGYLPGRRALQFNDFSGGAATVQPALERLGFRIVSLGPKGIPSPGEVLTNADIVRRFAVGNMGGMRRSTELNLLVLISDPFKGLYQDRWEGAVLTQAWGR